MDYAWFFPQCKINDCPRGTRFSEGLSSPSWEPVSTARVCDQRLREGTVMDAGIIIGAAVLCIVALALLLTRNLSTGK